MSAPPVTINGDLAMVTFDRFDLGLYPLFLRAKALPESQVAYDWQTDTYRLTTPARFADRLGVDDVPATRTTLPVADHLFDYQAWALRMALEAKRFAAWLDTGLGKTILYLEWARQVQAMTGGRVLIVAPLQVISQVIEMARDFYGPTFAIQQLHTRDDLDVWCRGAGTIDIGITNYEKFIPGVLPTLRRLAGLVADESGILKTGGGVIKWNLIKSARGIEYKLSCTATPAPNEAMEYASQAAFLEKLRTEGDILWTYFQRDKRGVWSVKPHARAAFYEFMSSWSVYLRDPATFGFHDILAELPEPEIIEHKLPMTDEQWARLSETLTRHKVGLWADDRVSVTVRQKLLQIARGFRYVGTGKDRAVERVASHKPGYVAATAIGEVEAGRQVLIWTTFDEEAEILSEGLHGVPYRIITGGMKLEARLEVLEWFAGNRCLCGDENTWPNTRASIQKCFDGPRSSKQSTTDGEENGTPPILPTERQQRHRPRSGTAKSDAMPGCERISESVQTNTMPCSNDRVADVPSASPSLGTQRDGGSPLITATTLEPSVDSFAPNATSASGSSETILSCSNVPSCTCGRESGQRVLISKPQLVGYGLNLQFVRSMIFSGFDDSFERMYQAVRRAYRYGQTETVRVFVPYVTELEGMVFENLQRKERRFLEEVAEQERAYRIALGMGT